MSKKDKSSKENLTNTEDSTNSTNKANNSSKNKVAEKLLITKEKCRYQPHIILRL